MVSPDDHLQQAGKCFDVTFGASSLGITLNLGTACVESILPGGQGESLEIHIGDRLLAMNGDPLLEMEDLGSLMNEMPGPAVLTFLRSAPLS